MIAIKVQQSLVAMEFEAFAKQHKENQNPETQVNEYHSRLTESMGNPMWIDASELKTLSSIQGMATRGVSQVPDAFTTSISKLDLIQTVQGLAQDFAYDTDPFPGTAQGAQVLLMPHQRQQTKNPANFNLVSAYGGNGLDAPSVGSLGHPHHCANACKYAHKGRGCKDGASCTRCHLCPWRRVVTRTATVKTIKRIE